MKEHNNTYFSMDRESGFTSLSLCLSLLALALVVYCSSRVAMANVSDGEKYFNDFCKSCHSIGGGDVVGPDLVNVHERRDEQWLVNFIKSSQSMIKSGDDQAVEVYGKYNRINMPDAPYSEDQIRDILDYIKAESAGEEISSGTGITDGLSGDDTNSYSEEEVASGRMLFTGRDSFDEGGPPCIACHDLKNDLTISGGTLAKGLTDSFSGLGAAGISSILGNPPFPVMQRAYKERPLNDTEISLLVAFLKDADSKQISEATINYSYKFMLTGFAGVFVLLGVFTLVWNNRKREPVFKSVFERQKKSE